MFLDGYIVCDRHGSPKMVLTVKLVMKKFFFFFEWTLDVDSLLGG